MPNQACIRYYMSSCQRLRAIWHCSKQMTHGIPSLGIPESISRLQLHVDESSAR